MKTETGVDIATAVDYLKNGELVAVPTETVYGLAANALNEDAVLKIYAAKNRPQFNPLIMHVASFEQAKKFIKDISAEAEQLAAAFWPGPLTMLFNKQQKGLGWAAFPKILMFQFIIPAFAPVADFFMLIGILTGNAGHSVLYYGLFMLVDASVSVLAFQFEKEKKSRLLWLLPQRLIYRWLMLAVLFKAFLNAIKGELQGWGVLKRTGSKGDRQLLQGCIEQIRQPANRNEKAHLCQIVPVHIIL